MGVVSALGGDWPTTAAALAQGRSGIAPITRFDATGMPCGVASMVSSDVTAGVDDSCVADRRTQLARRAVAEAWATAGLDGGVRLGVFVGAESGLACWAAAWDLSRAGAIGTQGQLARTARTARIARIASIASIDRSAFAAHPEAAIAWADPRRTSTPAVAWAVARQVGARGPCRTVALACASGAAAIVEAVRALRAGACDAAVCAGVGADVDPLMVAAFGRLGALSLRGRSVPFDAARDGFVLGEGAAALVLSIDRGDAMVALAGGARSFDGGSLTGPDPDSDGATRAIIDAIDDAGGPRIGYVAAHGTSTPAGDAAEAQALQAALGPELGGARVGAVKSALGHWIAGSGTLGAVCAWHAVARGELLPTIGVERIGRDCALPHVLHTAEPARVDAALACSFGFGGANACVVVRRAA